METFKQIVANYCQQTLNKSVPMEPFEKQKIVAKYARFCSATMLTSKIIT